MSRRAWQVVRLLLLVAICAVPSCDLWNRLFPRDYLVRREVKASEGATVETPDGKFRIEIPPGALSEDATVTISLSESVPAFPDTAIRKEGPYYSVSVGAAVLKDTCGVFFKLSTIPDTIEKWFFVMRFDDSLHYWECLGGRLAPNETLVSASTAQFSIFGVAAQPQPPPLGRVVLTVPFYMQTAPTYTNWCLPTSVTMQTRFYGGTFRYHQVAAALGLAQLEKPEYNLYYTRAIDLVYDAIVGHPPKKEFYLLLFPTPEELRTLLARRIQNGEPTIVGNEDHAVVVVGGTQDSVFIHDPLGKNGFGKAFLRQAFTWSELIAKLGLKCAFLWLEDAPAPYERRLGSLQTAGLHFEKGQYTSLLQPDGDGHPAGYYYDDPADVFDDDPGLDGLNLEHSPRKNDVMLLKVIVANTDSVRRSFNLKVDVVQQDGHRVAEVLNTVTDPVDAYDTMLVTADSFRLAGLDPGGRYFLDMVLSVDQTQQDQELVFFNVAGGNQPPNTPSTPSGPSSGYIDSTYSFTSSATDPDGDSVSIRFAWGDGDTSDWSNSVQGGTPVTVSRAWVSRDTYEVKAQAKDEQGLTSGWSASLVVSVFEPGSQGVLMWRYSAGEITGVPAIGEDGTVYFGSKNHGLYALNPDSTLRWRFQAAADVGDPVLGENSTIYFAAGDLYAVDCNGDSVWRHRPQDYSAGTPALGSDGTVYVPTYRIYDGAIEALRPDGSRRWRYYLPGGPTTPAIGSDGTAYVGTSPGLGSYSHIYAINQDSTLKWSLQLEFQLTCPAIGTDGVVYIGTGDRLWAIEPDGSERWRCYLQGQVMTDPVIGPDGTVYIGSSSGFTGYMNAVGSSGLRLWSLRIAEGNVVNSAAVDSDGIVYFGGGSFLDAAWPDSCLKWRLELGGCTTSPTTVSREGTLYIGVDMGYLGCYLCAVTGAHALADSPWPKVNHDLKNTSRACGGAR